MNKQKALKIINVLLILDFLGLVSTVVLSDAIPKELFFKIHPSFGIILIVLVIIHVILNFTWIKTTYFKTKKS
jgi:cytochrome b561